MCCYPRTILKALHVCIGEACVSDKCGGELHYIARCGLCDMLGYVCI